MRVVAWVFGLLLILLATRADAGPKCFDCTRVPYPRDCDHVTECGNHEVCHTKQLVSDSGHVFYDTGCMDSARCSRKRMAGNESVELAADETGDLATCLDCCQGDYCNSQGCMTPPLQHFPEARGPVCFNCPKGTVAPEDCEMVTVCNIDEYCYMEPMIGIGGDHLYKTGCKKCSDVSGVLVGKRASTQCFGCCKSDFCNHDCSSVSVTVASVTTTPISTIVTPTRHIQSSTTHTVTPTTKSSTPKSTSASSTRLSTAGSPWTTTRSSVPTTHSETRATGSPTSEQTKELQCLLLGYEYLKKFHHCVKPYHDMQLSWQKARDRCIQDEGDLLIFHNKAEESYFELWLKNMTGTKSRYWVGASDLLHEGDWRWVDSTPVDTKKYFYGGEPNDAEKHEDCAAATYHPTNSRVLLNDDNCDLPSYFICEANLNGLSIQTTASSQQHCRNHGYRYDSQHGICFKVYDNEMKTMAEARASCQSEHADLLQLRDRQTEIYFLFKGYEWKNATNRQFWLGATRHSDGQFYWFNGKPVTTSSYVWGHGEPNNAGNNYPENCLEFRHYPMTFLSSEQYALNDNNCNWKGYYICEERCPDKSYTYVPALDLCFKIYTSRVTWHQARDRCRVDHADLAEPNTLIKIDFFHRYLKTLGTPIYWIGGTQSMADPHKFLWQTTGQPIASELWHSGEPNNLLEQCASLYWYNRDNLDKLFRVNDMKCDYNNAYICQYIW